MFLLTLQMPHGGLREVFYFLPVQAGSDELHYVDYNLVTYGDTVSNGLTYHKLYETGRDSFITTTGLYLGTDTWFMRYTGAYREDGSKHIYYLQPYDTTMHLLYDFNLNLGDTLQPTYISPAPVNYVTMIDSVFDGMVYRRRFTVSTDTINQWNHNYASLIEGIGSSFGLLQMTVPFFESGGTLYCYKVNNVVKYVDSVNAICSLVGIETVQSPTNNLQLFPNPSNGIFQITLPNFSKVSNFGKVSYEIINTLGQKVFQSQILNPKSQINLNVSFLAKGIYVLKISSNDFLKSKILIID